MSNKKPDNVAWDITTESWVPGILPYGSNVGAPSIHPTDLTAWKKTGVIKANKKIHAKFLEIAEQYSKLLEETEWSKMIYEAKFNFEPIVGESYHLYLDKNGQTFLSMIKPNEWSMIHKGEFKLNSDYQWIKINK
jgi:hypothetical protein